MIAALATAMAHAPAQPAPVTIEDLLDAEGLGSVWFSPDGASLAFARQRPLTEVVTWGYDVASLVRERVFVMDRDGSVQEIVGDEDVRYSLPPQDPWTPDGKGLLLFAARQDHFGLAYWNAADGKLSHLPGHPYQPLLLYDWLDEQLIYAVLPDHGRQHAASMQVMETLNRRWPSAWNGTEPQVTVSSANPVFETTGPGPRALMLGDLRRGSAVKIAEGDYIAVSAAPDGRHVAAVRAAEPNAEALNLLSRRGELQVFERTADGLALRHQYDDLDVAGFDDALAWSPSGERLLVGGKPIGAARSEARLYLIEMRSGRRLEVASDGLSFINPGLNIGEALLPLGWIGDRPAAVAARKSASASVAATERQDVGLDYAEIRDLRFDVYGFGDSEAENLTAFAKASVNQFLVPDGDESALVIADAGLWRLAPGKSAERLSPAGAGPIIGFGIDPGYPGPPLDSAYYRTGDVERVSLNGLDGKGRRQRLVLDLKSGEVHPTGTRGDIAATAPDQMTTVSKSAEGWSTTLLLRDEGGDERRLLTVNRALKEKPVAPVERFSYRVGDEELTGWAVKPPSADPDTPLPAVVSVYGGAVYGTEPPSFAKPDVTLPIFNGQLLASEGYVVIFPSMPLRPGAETDVMGTLADQALAAVDALAAEGVVDRRRVGVMGQSFGGFSTAAILARRSDRVRAGVALAGIYDWMYSYGNRALGETLSEDGSVGGGEMAMVEIGQIHLGRPFWEDPEPYIRNSPIFHLETLDAPLLILQGDLDTGLTGLPGAERMYNALVRAGKSPALVRYWGEGHVAQSAPAVRDQWSRITAWFAHYLRE